MSYPIMPTLPISMAKGLTKKPNFTSEGQETAAGMGNSFVALKPFCTWDFDFDMDHITGNEAQAASVMAQFMGTYMACQGRVNLFLFTDPQDNTVTNMQFGTGDGTTTTFQLSRTIGGVAGAYDIIQNVNGTPTIYINGTPTTSFTVSSTGIVTFSSAPANAAILTWSGSFYFLCRFADDTIDSVRSFTTNSGTDQWDISSIKFSSEFVSSAFSGQLPSQPVVIPSGGIPVLQNPSGNQTISTYGLVVPFVVGALQNATSSPSAQITASGSGVWNVFGTSGGGISVRTTGDTHSRVFVGNSGSPALSFGGGSVSPDVVFNYSTGLLTLASGNMTFGNNVTVNGNATVSGTLICNQINDQASPTAEFQSNNAGVWNIYGNSGGGISIRQFSDAHSRVFVGNNGTGALQFGGGSGSPDVSFDYSTAALTMSAGLMAFSHNVTVGGNLYQTGSGVIYGNRLEDNHSSPNLTVTASASTNWNFTHPSGGGINILQSGDSHPRVSLLAGTEPVIKMGNGTANADVLFSRGFFASSGQPYLDLSFVNVGGELGFHIYRSGDANPRFDIGTTTTGDNSSIYMGDGTNIVDLGMTRIVDPNGGPSGNGVLTFAFWGANTVLTGLGVLADSTVATNTAGFSSSQAGRQWFSSTTNTINYWDGSTTRVVFAPKLVTKTANYTPTAKDYAINCNGTFTVTLPTTGIQTNQMYRIKNIGTGVITVSSSVNIDGSTSFTLNTQYQSIDVQWDGTQWWIY
jgi:uncharacterized protein (TIGR02217 family)